MRLDYVNPFIESAFLILGEVLNCQIKRGDLSLEEVSKPSLGVASFVGLAGEVEGRLMIDMTKETSLNVSNAMTGEDSSTINPLVESAITELNNLISGHAVSYLTNLGFKFDLTPPSFLLGNSTDYNVDIKTIIMPLETAYGLIKINISIKERY